MQLKWPMLWDLFSLFPAYAGVILLYDDEKLKNQSFPRIRGGDPIVRKASFDPEFFSPHTRG